MNFTTKIAVVLIAIFMGVCATSSTLKAADVLKGTMVYDRNGDIYSATAAGGGEAALTQFGDSHSPKWSPDGQKILFIRNTSLQMVTNTEGGIAEIGQPTDFYIMNRDGSDPHLLRHMEGVVKDPSWSPDGKKIGFFYQSKEEWLNQGIPGFISGFFVMPIEGSEGPHLVLADARHVDWSPNGKKLVFTVSRPSDHIALHTANIDGSDEAQLLDEETFVNADNAKWSPDGQEIALQATVLHKTPTNKAIFQSTIFVVHPDGTHIHQLTYDLNWDCWHPWWAHAEKKLNYSCYTMPACTPAQIKAHPDQCISRTFSIMTDDLHAKPVQVSEQSGVAGTLVPELSEK